MNSKNFLNRMMRVFQRRKPVLTTQPKMKKVPPIPIEETGEIEKLSEKWRFGNRSPVGMCYRREWPWGERPLPERMKGHH